MRLVFVLWVVCISTEGVPYGGNQVPVERSDYSMYDNQFYRVGDTELDNEVTDCGLVKHQFERGYIRLREYLERIQGCGRKGKMKNVEGIEESTEDGLPKETMERMAQATRQGFSYGHHQAVSVPAYQSQQITKGISQPQIPLQQPETQRTKPTGFTSFKNLGIRTEVTGPLSYTRNSPVQSPISQASQKRILNSSFNPQLQSAKTFHYQNRQKISTSPDPQRYYMEQTAKLAHAYGVPITLGQPLFRPNLSSLQYHQPQVAQAAKNNYEQHYGDGNGQGRNEVDLNPDKDKDQVNVKAENPDRNIENMTGQSKLKQLVSVNRNDDKEKKENEKENEKKENEKEEKEKEKEEKDNIDDDRNEGNQNDVIDEGTQARIVDDISDAKIVEAMAKQTVQNPKLKTGVPLEHFQAPISNPKTPQPSPKSSNLVIPEPSHDATKPTSKVVEPKNESNNRFNSNPANPDTNPQSNLNRNVNGDESTPKNPDEDNGTEDNVESVDNDLQQQKQNKLKDSLKPNSNANEWSGQAKNDVGVSVANQIQGTNSNQPQPENNPNAGTNLQESQNVQQNGANQNPHDVAINLGVLKNRILHSTDSGFLRRMLTLIRKITHHKDFHKLAGMQKNAIMSAGQAVDAVVGQRSHIQPRPQVMQPSDVTTVNSYMHTAQAQLRPPNIQRGDYTMNKALTRTAHAQRLETTEGHNYEVSKKFQIERNSYQAPRRIAYVPPYFSLQRLNYGIYNGNMP